MRSASVAAYNPTSGAEEFPKSAVPETPGRPVWWGDAGVWAKRPVV